MKLTFEKYVYLTTDYNSPTSPFLIMLKSNPLT